MQAAARVSPGHGPLRAGVTLGFDAARAEVLHRLVAPARLTRVLDIGANPANRPAYAPLLDMGLCQVWGFEPDAAAHAELERRKGANEHYLQAALGDGSEQVLHVYEWDTLNSLLPPATDRNARYLGQFGQALKLRRRLSCPTRRLDDVAEVPTPDLLKIDIQGAECMVLHHGAAKLAGTGAVIAEVAFAPVYKDQPLIGETMAELAGQGFAFHRMDFTAHFAMGSALLDRLSRVPVRSQAVDGDALFLREAYLTEGAPLADPEPLRHLALIADAVFGSVDVACRALSLLDARVGLNPDLLDRYLDMLDARAGA
jgi:FkbM family methyltransferase